VFDGPIGALFGRLDRRKKNNVAVMREVITRTAQQGGPDANSALVIAAGALGLGRLSRSRGAAADPTILPAKPAAEMPNTIVGSVTASVKFKYSPLEPPYRLKASAMKP
jgi:hypothetical protein